MKTIKILLGIIAINLTLLTIIQTGIWPPKVQANSENFTAAYGGSYGVADGGYYYSWKDNSDLIHWQRSGASVFIKKTKLP